MRQFACWLIIPALLICFAQGNTPLRAAELQGCYASLENDVLTLGNERIRRTFAWNNGNLISQAIADVAADQELTFEDKRVDFSLGELTKKARSAEWTSRVVKNSTTPPQLQVEIVTSFDAIDVRRVFRIYPNCSAIGCDYYLRVRNDAVSPFAPAATTLQTVRLPGVHWRYRAVEFLDRTDQINNLVKESSALAYTHPVQLRGNILLAQNPLGQPALFMIKEAPCSFVQLHYPEFDFSCSINETKVVGLGIAAEDLVKGEWIRAYGLATGICEASETAILRSLRLYQKQLRQQLPARDDMIMMNTWGDRNRDARIGEQFVNQQVDACSQLGISHLQIDDGWQQGLSRNSASASGKLWDLWDESSWQPHGDRFPNGFAPVVKHAKRQGVDLGLWFHPSNADDYASWQRDAQIVINLYRNFGVRYFKIDGIKLPTKQSEVNLRRFLDRVLDETDGQVVFNLDATADNRGGYLYMYEYGNIFLENRYTDFGRYYPYWTLRNLWMLSKYVAPERLQIEFLNKWRNPDKYAAHDPLAPRAIPFDYQFAVTMMAQPLAWFEGSELPEEGRAIAPLIKAYRAVQSGIHRGVILPIGDEPNGTAWTGFQSLVDQEHGFLLVIREYNDVAAAKILLYDLAGKTISCEQIGGHGKSRLMTVDTDGMVRFELPGPHTFALYRYEIK